MHRRIKSPAPRVPCALPVAMMLAAGPAVAAPPPGQLLASQCFQCHGTNGRAVAGFESITGRSAKDMYKLLLELSRRPPETIMDLQARAYTPAQLKLLSEYLATLPTTSEELPD